MTGPVNSRQGEYLNGIKVSTRALFDLINGILDLASIDAGAITLNLQSLDVGHIVRDAAEGVRYRLIDGTTLGLRTGQNIGQFVADERRIRQILFALLSIAIDTSPTGANIVLEAQRVSNTVVFSVSSRESSASLDEVDTMFRSGYPSSGLGLSVARSFVELHGGTFQIKAGAEGGMAAICVFPSRKG